MMRKIRITVVLALLMLLLTTPGLAQGSTGVLSFQGYLSDASGNPLSGSYDLRFSIYDAETGGTAVWGPETHEGVSVSDGLFAVSLGSEEPLDAEVFDGGDRWLEVAVWNGEAWETLSPRLLIGSAAYAFSAGDLTPGTTISGSGSESTLTIYYTAEGRERTVEAPLSPVQTVKGETKSSRDHAAGVCGIASTAPNIWSTGVHGSVASDASDAAGVYGLASATSGRVYGVYGEQGVQGEARATDNWASQGVVGVTQSGTDGAAGVYGYSEQYYGVVGRTDSPADGSVGVCGSTLQTAGRLCGVCGRGGTGVHGHSRTTGDGGATYGVFGQTDSSTTGAAGVMGRADEHGYGCLLYTSPSPRD